MGNRADWQPLVDAGLGTYTCLAIDLPGHGEAVSWASNDWSFAAVVKAVIASCDTHNVKRIIPVGYSMGGRIALYLAHAFPERCAGLVLESASPGLRTNAERAARRRLDSERAERIQAQPFAEFLADWYAMPLFASLHRFPDRFALMHARRLRNDAAALARALIALGTGEQPSLWERLPTLGVATLALSGALDTKFVRIGAEMAALAPRLQHRIIQDAGHIVHIEQPVAFCSHLSSFIDQLYADGYR